MRALNNASVAIYPVDARGVTNPAISMPSGSPRQSLPPQMPWNVEANSTHTMFDLAQQSGGRVIRNGNDIAGGIRRAMDDSRLSYVLAYYPSHGTWDGKYHHLKVAVNRRGVEVLHRRGYFAMPNEGAVEDYRGAMLRAAASPLDATGLGLAVRVPNRGVKAQEPLELKIQLDPGELQYQEAGGQRFVALNVLFVFRDGDGRNIGGGQPLRNVRLRVQNQGQARSEPLVLDAHEPMREGARELRAVVRDATSGALGSLTVPFPREK
jgi:hypothetical protein